MPHQHRTFPTIARRRAIAAVLGLCLCAQAGATSDQGAPDLSAYFGAPVLPNQIVALCPGTPAVIGRGGMPIVFDREIVADAFGGDPDALDPAHFRVRVGPEGEVVTPICATLQPAVDATERRTVLLVGDFGNGADNMPQAVRIVGDVMTADGGNLRGLTVADVSPTEAGSQLVLAERFDVADGLIDTSNGDDAYCPAESTAVVLKLTFSGGVSGFNGASITGDDDAAAAVLVVAINAQGARVVLSPFALADDDNDNHVDACFGAQAEGFAFERVSVMSQFFFAPMNVPNQSMAVPIISR